MYPLAGMQSMSFIPGTNLERFVPGVAPSYEDVLSGRDMVKYDKIPVRISDFRVEVFDMMDKGRKEEYEKLMKDLVLGVQRADTVIWKNELQIMTVDGNQHWMRYLEWAKYEVNESSVSTPVDRTDSVKPTGVLNEVGQEDEDAKEA